MPDVRSLLLYCPGIFLIIVLVVILQQGSARLQRGAITEHVCMCLEGPFRALSSIVSELLYVQIAFCH